MSFLCHVMTHQTNTYDHRMCLSSYSHCTQTSRRRINLADFLSDGDTLNLGDISRTKFRYVCVGMYVLHLIMLEAYIYAHLPTYIPTYLPTYLHTYRSSLARAGIQLLPHEHIFLETHFAHQARPDKVNWKAFHAKLSETSCPAEAQLEIVSQVSESMYIDREGWMDDRITVCYVCVGRLCVLPNDIRTKASALFTYSCMLMLHNVCMYVCIYVCMYVCMDGWMDGWMDVHNDSLRIVPYSSCSPPSKLASAKDASTSSLTSKLLIAVTPLR